jgi:hypothetical protein
MTLHTTRYTLRSTSLIYAPGVVQYARDLAKQQGKGSRKSKFIAKQLIGAWNLPDKIAKRLLHPDFTPLYDLDNGVVIVTD